MFWDGQESGIQLIITQPVVQHVYFEINGFDASENQFWILRDAGMEPYQYPTQDFPPELLDEEAMSDDPHKAAGVDSDVVVMEPSPLLSPVHPDNQLGMSPTYFAGMLPSPNSTEIAPR